MGCGGDGGGLAGQVGCQHGGGQDLQLAVLKLNSFKVWTGYLYS